MPIVPRFDPASVVERPPEPIPAYDKAGYFNPDRDSYVTHKQACAIAKAMAYYPHLYIVKATIPKSTQLFKIEDEKGEYRYRCLWSNGFQQTLPAIGRLLDIAGKRDPDTAIKHVLKRIYDEMLATDFEVPDWVYDRVK